MTTMIDTARRRLSRRVEEIRASVPGAASERTTGFPVAYLDGPGGTQVPRGVVDAMDDYLYQSQRQHALALSDE